MELPKETKQDLRKSLDRFLAERLDEEGRALTQVQRTALFRFILTEFGPTFYNRAITDAQRALLERVQELDAVCYEPERPFWPPENRPESRQ